MRVKKDTKASCIIRKVDGIVDSDSRPVSDGKRPPKLLRGGNRQHFEEGRASNGQQCAM